MHASVADPLKDVRMLFERAGCPVSCGGDDWGVQAHFEALLSDPAIRAQVCAQELARSHAVCTACMLQPGAVSVLAFVHVF